MPTALKSNLSAALNMSAGPLAGLASQVIAGKALAPRVELPRLAKKFPCLALKVKQKCPLGGYKGITVSRT